VKIGDLVIFENVTPGDGHWVVEFCQNRTPMVVIELGPGPFHMVVADPTGTLQFPRRSSLTVLSKI
jgi:hypothetical protein